MRILLVENVALLAVVMEDTLQSAGHAVKVVATGNAALARFHEGHPRADLLIVEAALPDMAGWDALTACRAICPGLPAVVVTTSPVHDFRIQNFAVTLEKPFTEDALLSAVQAAITPR